MRRFLVLALGALVGCGPPPLANTQPSSEALAREVLAALERRDEARLRALALNAEEFERHVWPGLPAARPERNLPMAYVWGELQQKSDQALRTTLASEGGRRYELEAVRFDGETTDHGSYRVQRQSVFVVRGAQGTHDLRVIGSMIEQNGGWKVFSFVTDD